MGYLLWHAFPAVCVPSKEIACWHSWRLHAIRERIAKPSTAIVAAAADGIQSISKSSLLCRIVARAALAYAAEAVVVAQVLQPLRGAVRTASICHTPTAAKRNLAHLVCSCPGACGLALFCTVTTRSGQAHGLRRAVGRAQQWHISTPTSMSTRARSANPANSKAEREASS